MRNIDSIFETALKFHHYANTAYPLTPTSLRNYELHDKDQIKKCITENISNQKEICLYVHIPFCEHRCKFCEYVVLDDHGDQSVQDKYVDYLLKEISLYKDIIKDIPIIGYDMGGGTPLFLTNENLKKITDAIKEFNLSDKLTYSIETTPLIASKNIEKLKYVKSIGYNRISMGFQTINENLLQKLNRDGSKYIYDVAVENIRKAGFTRLNIDLMYGFANQSNEDFLATINYTISKKPEYITLYRNRYKGTKLEADAGAVSLYKANTQYELAYNALINAGYKANYGKNTFSLVENDYGTSDYLTTRVIDATSYVGFGLGAQSFVGNYLAYNLGCADHRLTKYFEALDNNKFPINDIADMPIEEVRAKVLSVMFYFGFISLSAYKRRFNEDILDIFKDEIAYLIDNNLMELKDDMLIITKRGAELLPGCISLFYSKRSIEEMYKLLDKKVDAKAYDETFLHFYNKDSFKSPSVATDIIVLNDIKSKILLITRAENPYANKLALPGGFYTKKDKSVKDCAKRELQEETGIKLDNLELRFINDKRNRDPRGWIISAVYEGKYNGSIIQSGSDALFAKWYDINSLKEEDLAFDHYETIKKIIK